VVVRRRTQFELDKALKRAHILEGLKIALKFIDRIIKVIKTSKSVEAAKVNLMKEFELSELQSQAILEMQLQPQHRNCGSRDSFRMLELLPLALSPTLYILISSFRNVQGYLQLNLRE